MIKYEIIKYKNMNNNNCIGTLAAVIFAISFTLLDFNDLSFANNKKSYIGLLLFVALTIYFIKNKIKK
jgi:hypothetical protein